jgi:hypothetical protein
MIYGEKACSYEKHDDSHRDTCTVQIETEPREAEMIIHIYRLIIVQTGWNHFIVIFLRLACPRLSHLQFSLLFTFVAQLEEQLR